MKGIYSGKKYLIIGIILSLILHIFLFSFLYFTKPENKKVKKKEKPIEISLIPYEKKSKVQKNTGKKNVIREKTKRKKIIKKKIKKIKKKPQRKILKKHKIVKKQIKKTKPILPKPTKKIEKKEKPVIKKEIVKEKPKFEKKAVKKELKPVKKEKTPVVKKILKQKPVPETEKNLPSKNLVIPDLSKSLEHKPQKKETKKDKAVLDYLKYIKIEFEKNKFYPDRAKKLGIEGIVVLKFTILPDGTIDKKSIQVVEADHPFLAKGAVRIFEKIKKLKKPPPNGEKMTVEIPIQYILYELY